MKVIFTNPSTNEPQVPVRRTEKTSTTELKQALQKIKQTQLEVLKVLRTQSQTSNLTQTEMKAITQNIQSITNVNLLKIAEVTNMRKDMERQKQNFSERLATINKKNQFLEQQLSRWRAAEQQWVNQRAALFQKLQILNLERNQYTNSLKSEQQMKGMLINYQQELNAKKKEKLVLETEMQALHQKIIQLSQQKQKFKTRCEQLNKQLIQKQKKIFIESKKSEERQRSAIPYDEIITQIKKISSHHSQIYNSLKSRSKITIQDLDKEEKIQQSLSKILRVIDFAQKAYLSNKKLSEDKSAKVPENHSYVDQVKRLEREMVESEVLKNSIAQLKTENWQLKSNNTELQNGIKDLQAKLKQYEQQIQNNRQSTGIFQLKQYNQLVQQLKKEMTNIREEKQALATLVKTFGQNSIKQPDANEGGMKLLRMQLDEIIALNNQLRNQNDRLKASIDAFKLQIEALKFQERKYEDKLLQKHVLVEKEVKEKQYLISELKRYEKIHQQKESTISKQEGKIAELTATIQANFIKYQQELKFKMEQTNALRQQIQRNMKENRELREIAYDHQLLTKQNDVIKKTIMHLNPTIIHLWQIKQAEYANIDTIIAAARKT